MDDELLFILSEHIREFLASDKRASMLEGLKYYKMKNVPDGKLSHGFIPSLIDEKVQYICGSPVTFDADIPEEGTRFREVLRDKFDEYLMNYIREAAIKGQSWWQVYINEEGLLDYSLIPAEQVCPLWADDEETILESVLRIYELDYYVGRDRRKLTKVEHWEADGVTYYEWDGQVLLLDSEKYLGIPDNMKAGHFVKGKDTQMAFGIVPFVGVKNNFYCIPDHKYVQSLVDDYNERAQELSELLTDSRNFITEIRNYGGSPNDDIKAMIKSGIIKTDDNGAVVFHTPAIDTKAVEYKLNTLREDINTFGRAIPGPDKLGSAPNEMTVKALYAKVDLKCNAVKLSVSNALDRLRELINVYMSQTGQQLFDDLDVTYNTSMLVNESSLIEDIIKSMPLLSKETLISKHPFVVDIVTELDRKAKEAEEEAAMFDPYSNLPPEDGVE